MSEDPRNPKDWKFTPPENVDDLVRDLHKHRERASQSHVPKKDE